MAASTIATTTGLSSIYDGLYGRNRCYTNDDDEEDDVNESENEYEKEQNEVGKQEEEEEVIDNDDDEDEDDYEQEHEHVPTERRGKNAKQSATTNPTNTNDTKRVIVFKILVIVILIISATMIAIGIHRYIENSEQATFEAKFNADANKVFAMMGSSIDKTLGTLNAISMLYVSYGNINPNVTATFPFVTIPNYALQISKMLHLTDGLYISVNPIVTPNEKLAFETYMYEQDVWVNDTFAVQDVWDGYHGNKSTEGYNWSRNKNIYGVFGNVEDNVTRYMLPTWQSFPIAVHEEGAPVYGFDWNSQLQATSVQTCIEKSHVVLSEPYMIPSLSDPTLNDEMEIWAQHFASFLPQGEEPFEPMLDVLYPIINDVSPYAATHDKGDHPNNTVGMLAIPIYWRQLFRNILSEGSCGIVVEVHNPCSEPFTYQINGASADYIGAGDLHDRRYDHLQKTSKLVDLNLYKVDDAEYSGAHIDDDYCPYTLHIYASDAMKATFTTNDATIFTVLVMLIFLFVAFVFFVYDWFVERRQVKVMFTALRSTAIVSSLFPSSVREQLYETTGHKQKKSNREKKINEAANCSNVAKNESNDVNGTDEIILGPPIAQVYPETTVIFADIVGFTAWSSTREPTQVFHLLETLYCGFDRLARKRGVFKVETIGDSYVAVVGLPINRKNHAVVAVRFAYDMRAKMKEMVGELEKTLGVETSYLTLRIGLNSGPTTAGVLRGEKARFQLFGDTVNTAARMESNGEPSKIHVSESTAELLRAAGKDNWLVTRDEQIMAKGKGMMQTYWCEFTTRSSSTKTKRSSNTATSIADDEEISYNDTTTCTNYYERGDECVQCACNQQMSNLLPHEV